MKQLMIIDVLQRVALALAFALSIITLWGSNRWATSLPSQNPRCHVAGSCATRKSPHKVHYSRIFLSLFFNQEGGGGLHLHFELARGSGRRRHCWLECFLIRQMTWASTLKKVALTSISRMRKMSLKSAEACFLCHHFCYSLPWSGLFLRHQRSASTCSEDTTDL